MRITCPQCRFSKNIPDSKIPPAATRVSCPKCGSKFDLNSPGVSFPETDPGYHENPSAEKIMAGVSAFPSEDTIIPPSIEEADRVSSDKDIPWESKSGGMLASLFKTIKQVLFSPGDFYSRLKPHGNAAYPISFAVLTSIVPYLVTLFFQFSLFAPSLNQLNDIGIPLEALAGPVLFIGVAILLPILLVISLYLGAAVIHVSLIIVFGRNERFPATFRVLAYTSAAQIWSIIPFVGPLASCIWALVLSVVGLSKVHHISKTRAFFALFLLPIVIGAVSLVLVILIPLLMTMTGFTL